MVPRLSFLRRRALPHTSARSRYWRTPTHAARAIAACALCAPLGIIGCVGPKPPPTVVSAQGTPLPEATLLSLPALSSAQRQWGVRISPPNGAWSASLDQTRPAWGYTEAYITLWSPSPLAQQPATPAPFTVALGARADRPVRVYSRIATAQQLVDDDAPYTLLVHSEDPLPTGTDHAP